MGPDDNADLGFQPRGGNLLNCSSSGMYTTSESENVEGMPMGSMPISRSLNSVDSFFGAGWDPYASLAQNVEFRGSPAASHNQIATSQYGIGTLENQGISSTSHLVRYPSNASLIRPAPKLTCFGSGSGSFSDMVTSYDLPECGQIADACCPLNFSNKERGAEKTSRNGTVHSAICQEDRQISDERTGAPSPNGRKRKMAPETHSQFDPIHHAKGEQQKDISKENIEGSKEHDEKKQKTEQNTGTNLRAKLMGKQAKDHSQGGEAAKDDFIHVRARRGQATNSHSLAERVRREKISERMRFLQDLVPGCNKITGKAVMLDEIINYVQSLQRQVEFLSMKLSTVNPELNIDIERILSKDILHSQGGYSALLGFSQGMSALNPQPHTSQCGSLAAIQSTNHHLLPMSQAPSVWDNELQNVMHFISNPDFDCLEANGGMKVEL